MPAAPASDEFRDECWVVTNGAAGNERQALALAEYMPWPVRTLVAEPRAPWSWLAPRHLPGSRLAWSEAADTMLTPPWPRLVIGCGRAAALFTRLIRHLSGGACPAVQILDPRIDTRHWDVVIAPQHDDVRGPNVLRPLGSLHGVDDAWLDDARRAWAHMQDLPAPRLSVLLGGPRHGIPLDVDYAHALGDVLLARHRRDGGSVSLLASRRTPVSLFSLLRDILGDIPGVRWGSDDDGTNPYPGVLAWADRLLVTPDSVNMLSEACATGRPVHTLVSTPLHGKMARFHAQLHKRGLLHAADAETADHQTPLRETAAIAAKVRERLALTT